PRRTRWPRCTERLDLSSEDAPAGGRRAGARRATSCARVRQGGELAAWNSAIVRMRVSRDTELRRCTNADLPGIGSDAGVRMRISQGSGAAPLHECGFLHPGGGRIGLTLSRPVARSSLLADFPLLPVAGVDHPNPDDGQLVTQAV